MSIIVIIAILIMSVVIHEVAHGSVANRLGDPTAKYAGRLTLNPIKHLDFIGSFLLPLIMIVLGSGFILGWAKPVPVNPYNFKDQKYGKLKVAIAGPLSNLSIVLFFSILARLIPIDSITRSNIVNYFPEFISSGFWSQIFYFFIFIIFINLLLAIFNLIPIPPLDGSHILFTFFPSLEYKFKEFYAKTGFLGMFILIFLIFNTLPYLMNFIFYFFKIIIS